MKIYKATVCSFSERQKTDMGYRYIRTVDNCFYITCIKMGDNVIDIKTKKVYPLLRKNKDGYILTEEFSKIQFYVDYAIDIIELEKAKKNIFVKIQAANTKRVEKNKQKILKR